MTRLKAMKCSRLRGKKGVAHNSPDDPPRQRALSQHGRGNFANDRPPVLGAVGRESQDIRLAVIADTSHETLDRQLVEWTDEDSNIYTDSWQGFDDLTRNHAQVNHNQNEWARDDDGDGIREVHTNTIEGTWTGLRIRLRPFRGVSKHYLSGYVALYECEINVGEISPTFIHNILCLHSPYT